VKFGGHKDKKVAARQKKHPPERLFYHWAKHKGNDEERQGYLQLVHRIAENPEAQHHPNVAGGEADTVKIRPRIADINSIAVTLLIGN